MNHKKILIVEDDIGLNNGIALSLKQDAYEFIQTYSLSAARKERENHKFDLILLDVNLPDGSGFDLCKEIRREDATPIIFLTANDMEIDIVTGLELGADDYITKPFSLMVLRARVGVIMRRNDCKDVEQLKASQVNVGPYRFDFANMIYMNGDRAIELSKTEQKLLKIFAMNQGQKLSRSLLIDRIWTDGAEYVDENALSVTVKRLRDKLEDEHYIKTVYGVGYIWDK